MSEAADVLEVRPETVRRWADGGYLRFERFGPHGYRRFRRGDVEDLAARHRETAQPPAVDAG